MPPKQSQRLKRKSSDVQATSAPRRRGRPQTLPPAPNDQDEHEVDALPNVVASHPPSMVNAFPPDLVQSLVSTVTAEVMKQLSVILPALSLLLPQQSQVVALQVLIQQQCWSTGL